MRYCKRHDRFPCGFPYDTERPCQIVNMVEDTGDLYRFVPNDQSKVNGKVVPEVAINGRWVRVGEEPE